MKKKINQYNILLSNKLFSLLPSIKRLNNPTNELNLQTPITQIYYFENANFWYAKGEKEDKYVYIFGLKNKAIHKITPKDATLIIDFNKNYQYNNDSLGIFFVKNSKIHIFLNETILNKKHPYINTGKFKARKFQSIDKTLKLDVIDLGDINTDFIENLEKLITEIEPSDEEICDICSKNIIYTKIDSRLKNLKRFKPELCGKCIEKIVVSEFYDAVKPFIRGNDPESLEIAREKFGRYELFEYGIKLLEKYKIIQYIGVKKQFFTIDSNSYIVAKYKKYSDPDNLLIDNIFQTKNKQTKKKDKPIDIRDTTLSPETKSRMNLFINALKSGKTHDEAYRIAKLNNQKVENWYKFGKRGDFNYIPFYNEYKTLRPENIERIEKMDVFLSSLKNDNDIENALKESNLTHGKVRAWYSLGEKGSEEFRDFYLACKILLPDGIPKRETKKIVDNEELMNEFIALIEAGKSNDEAINQLKIPKFKVKNWVNQGKLGNKKYTTFYNTYMIEIKKERELRKAKKRAKKILKQKEKEEKLKKIVNESPETSSAKNCEICGRTLNKQSKNKICKRCARKQYAAKILIRLLRSINPEIPFKKDDLKILGLESFQVQDYIWTLQEFNLISKENNKFKLKDKETLEDFIKSSGLDVNEIETDDAKVKLNKTCKKCGETLEISKFFPSKTTEDGFEDNCKDCKKLITTAGYLNEILEFVDYESTFSEDDLSHYFPESFKLQAKIWSLLDNDLAIRNFETNNYTLTDRKTGEDFLDKYFEEKTENSTQTSTTGKHPKKYTKEDQMKIVIKAISEGKSRKEAADEANIPLYKINHWYKEGEQGYGNENRKFYKQLKDIEEIKERKNRQLKNKMEKVLSELRNGKNISQITITNETEINDWIEKGKQNKEPYNEFYDNYMEVKNNLEKPKIPQIKKSDHFGTSLSTTQMNVILEKLVIGMDERKAVNEANISFNTYKYWLNRGKQGFGKLYTQFYNYVNQIKNGEYSQIEQQKPIDKKDLNPEEIPLEIDPDIYAPLNEEHKKAFKGRTTTTGIAWVNKIGDKWFYSTTIKGQPIRINSESIYKLHKKVKNKNYPWGIRDYKKASSIIKIPQENIIPEEEDAPNEPIIENDELKTEIYAPLPKKYLETFPKQSNQTGIAWVNKIGNQFIYSRKVNGKTIKITDTDIEELHKKVINENQIWGIRNYTNARKFINIPDDFKISEINKKDNSKGIQEEKTDIYAPLSPKHHSKFNPNPNNKTGIAWVNRVGNNWSYQRKRNGKTIRIIDSDIHKLHEKVIKNNQIWGIIDYDKARHIIEKNEPIVDEPRKTTPLENINEVTVNYISKNGIINIIIKGMIRNNELIKILNILDIFEQDFKRIITTSINEKTDIFIELEIKNNLEYAFEQRIKELGWEINYFKPI